MSTLCSFVKVASLLLTPQRNARITLTFTLSRQSSFRNLAEANLFPA